MFAPMEGWRTGKEGVGEIFGRICLLNYGLLSKKGHHILRSFLLDMELPFSYVQHNQKRVLIIHSLSVNLHH